MGPLRWLALIVFAGIVAVPLFMTSPFYIHLAVLVCLNVTIASGLLMLSRTGQLSLCQAAFVGVGAYVSVLTGTHFAFPFLLSALLGAAASALVAFLLGAAILRLRGVYFVLITFAFGELFRLAMLQAAPITGGANGIAGIPSASIFGFDFDTRKAFYCLAAAVALASLAFLLALFRTAKGHAIDAAGQNPNLAEATGISVRNTQLFAFTVGSGFAGLTGALLASYVGYISPESFNTSVSIGVVIMLVVGGRNSVLGPLIGSFIMTPLPELFRGAVQSQNIFYGVALILILRFLPQGIAGLRLFRRIEGEQV
ncbi:branched-chain amino acid ABC transporter permease [Afifella sp. IM 167]|nr:branched-chain amino acid ABC transporter permease [Afifella sp. IM 167]